LLKHKGELQQGLDRIKERMVESPHKGEVQGLDRIKERMSSNDGDPMPLDI
jgi:hypothetical protein